MLEEDNQQETKVEVDKNSTNKCFAVAAMWYEKTHDIMKIMQNQRKH